MAPALATVRQLEKDLIMQTGGAAVVKKTEDGKVDMVTRAGAASAGAAMGGFWGHALRPDLPGPGVQGHAGQGHRGPDATRK